MEHIQWLFSGAGLALVLAVATWWRKKKNTRSLVIEGVNINSGGNASVSNESGPEGSLEIKNVVIDAKGDATVENVKKKK